MAARAFNSMPPIISQAMVDNKLLIGKISEKF
jgi:hypothetical protein